MSRGSNFLVTFAASIIGTTAGIVLSDLLVAKYVDSNEEQDDTKIFQDNTSECLKDMNDRINEILDTLKPVPDKVNIILETSKAAADIVAHQPCNEMQKETNEMKKETEIIRVNTDKIKDKIDSLFTECIRQSRKPTDQSITLRTLGELIDEFEISIQNLKSILLNENEVDIIDEIDTRCSSQDKIDNDYQDLSNEETLSIKCIKLTPSEYSRIRTYINNRISESSNIHDSNVNDSENES